MRKTVRILWWIGVPLLVMAWLLLPESAKYELFGPFSIESTTLHPIAGELVTSYRATAAALVILIVVAAWSHRRNVLG